MSALFTTFATTTGTILTTAGAQVTQGPSAGPFPQITSAPPPSSYNVFGGSSGANRLDATTSPILATLALGMALVAFLRLR